MKIKKILNNNVAIVLDRPGKECIVTGKGIVFGKHAGDDIGNEGIEKIFKLQERGITEKLSRIIGDIPLDHIRVCDEIINTARRELPNVGEKIYLTLIDHISYAIERHKANLDLVSSLKWELMRFYPEEYRMGNRALDIIEKRLGIRLPNDEAAFIAFHLVNAGGQTNINLEESLQFVTSILEIIKGKLHVEFDEDLVSYGRLLVHLRYFSRRVISRSSRDVSRPDSGEFPARPANTLLFNLETDYPDETSCAGRICDFITGTYGYQVNDEEKSYLIIHLHSLVSGK
jgi:beta-glucoside operon transcriptional antiterminator